MPTHEYRSKGGVRLPGVTTVIGQNLGWSKEGLKWWANQEGLAGRNIRDRDNYGQIAADIGTAAHAMIDLYLHGQDPETAHELIDLPPEQRERARAAFRMFRKWFANSKTEVIATECWAVDDEYQTGGTIDGLFLEQDEDEKLVLSLADWKTSKAVYSEYFIQISAYSVFVERFLSKLFDRDVRLAGAHIIRVGKDSGTFEHRFWERGLLDEGWKAFTWLRALHEHKKVVEKYVR